MSHVRNGCHHPTCQTKSRKGHASRWEAGLSARGLPPDLPAARNNQPPTHMIFYFALFTGLSRLSITSVQSIAIAYFIFHFCIYCFFRHCAILQFSAVRAISAPLSLGRAGYKRLPFPKGQDARDFFFASKRTGCP